MTANRSVARALAALKLIASSSTPLGLGELARALDVPKSTLHSLLEALVEARFVQRRSDGRYGLDLKAFELGAAYVERVTPRAVIRPELLDLCLQLGVTAHFAVLDGAAALYLEKEDPPQRAIRLASALGARLPAHLTAVGKACLSVLPPEKALRSVDLSVPGEGGRVLRSDDLLSELASVRSRGYATDFGEVLAGVTCVAAPVLDAKGQGIGAIGVSYLSGSDVSVEAVAAAVAAAARRASDALGSRVQEGA